MQFSVLCRELASGPQLVADLVTGMTRAEARSKPDPESWSILEVLCHLYDEEREDFRARLDIILNHPGEKWPPIDPQGWVTSRNYSERDLTNMVAAFSDERKKSLAWLKGLGDRNWDSEYAAPFGTVRAGNLLASWAAHDLLHIRQLVELRRIHILNAAKPYDVTYAGKW